MKVFVTGATGFIGSAVVDELLSAGHEVLGLARSDAGAAKLEARGAKVHRGALEDLESLKAGARQADGVIHTAFVHTFPGVLLAVGKDKKAIDALGSALEGSHRPLVTAGGVISLRRGQLLTEDFRPEKNPRKSEPTTMTWAARGVRASVIRLSPTVHGTGDKAFVATLVKHARKNRAAYFVGDGHQRWPAVHRLDAARLFRLALERGKAGSAYHGVADEGVPFFPPLPLDKSAPHTPEANYIAFGRVGALYMVHLITGAPEYDQILFGHVVTGVDDMVLAPSITLVNNRKPNDVLAPPAGSLRPPSSGALGDAPGLGAAGSPPSRRRPGTP